MLVMIMDHYTEHIYCVYIYIYYLWSRPTVKQLKHHGNINQETIYAASFENWMENTVKGKDQTKKTQPETEGEAAGRQNPTGTHLICMQAGVHQPEKLQLWATASDLFQVRF